MINVEMNHICFINTLFNEYAVAKWAQLMWKTEMTYTLAITRRYSGTTGRAKSVLRHPGCIDVQKGSIEKSSLFHV